jgi:hypothetical protein
MNQPIRTRARTLIGPEPRSRRIYLHAPRESEATRTEITLALKADGIVPLWAPVVASEQRADGEREAKNRIETAKRCEALALLRVENDERFISDLLDIGVDEREQIAAARHARLPCAVLDNTGERLPFDVTPFGIERFDISRSDWRGQFRAWLDAARVAVASDGVAPAG